MDASIKHWVDLWDYLDDNFWQVWHWAAGRLGPEEVSWRPAPAVASVGWNLQHLAEMLDYYLARVFRENEPVRQPPWVTMRPGGRDDGRFGDLQAVADYHRQVRPAYREFLADRTGADLERVIERMGRRPLTVAWAVGHIAEHESYHLGKVTLLRSLIASRREG